MIWMIGEGGQSDNRNLSLLPLTLKILPSSGLILSWKRRAEQEQELRFKQSWNQFNPLECLSLALLVYLLDWLLQAFVHPRLSLQQTAADHHSSKDTPARDQLEVNSGSNQP